MVWATAATAIHNLQQGGSEWTNEKFSRFRIEEDPLAYLGILVDCIQEWDRYTASRGTLIAGRLPMQGIDVKLGTSSGRVVLEFPSVKAAERVREGLNEALLEWDSVLEVRPASAKR